MIGKQTISKVSTTLEEGLAKELRDQGHYLTGALERSITSRESSTANAEVLETTALDYIDKLNDGVDPSQLGNFNQHVAEMTEYAKKRMKLGGRLAAKVGYRIAQKHAEEGIPTANSYQFSSTGERLHVIEETYEHNEAVFDQQIEDGLSNELDSFIDKTFDQTIF